MVLDPETGMHDDALKEIVVIRYYFNNDIFSYGNKINKQSSTEHVLLSCSYTSICNIWILIMLVYVLLLQE